MRHAQRAADDWLETLHARNDKQLSMKPPSLSAVAKPWQTLEASPQPHLLHQNITSSLKVSRRQDHAMNASLLGARSETVDCSFSRCLPREVSCRHLHGIVRRVDWCLNCQGKVPKDVADQHKGAAAPSSCSKNVVTEFTCLSLSTPKNALQHRLCRVHCCHCWSSIRSDVPASRCLSNTWLRVSA